MCVCELSFLVCSSLMISQIQRVILKMRGSPYQLPELVYCHGNTIIRPFLLTLQLAFLNICTGLSTIFGHRESHSNRCCCHRQQEWSGRHPAQSILGVVPTATPVGVARVAVHHLLEEELLLEEEELQEEEVVLICLPVTAPLDLRSLTLTPPTR